MGEGSDAKTKAYGPGLSVRVCSAGAAEDYVRSGFTSVGDFLVREHNLTGFGDVAWQLFERGARGNTFDQALARLDRADLIPIVPVLVERYRGHEPNIRLCADAREAIDRLRGNHPIAMIRAVVCGQQLGVDVQPFGRRPRRSRVKQPESPSVNEEAVRRTIVATVSDEDTFRRATVCVETSESVRVGLGVNDGDRSALVSCQPAALRSTLNLVSELGEDGSPVVDRRH